MGLSTPTSTRTADRRGWERGGGRGSAPQGAQPGGEECRGPGLRDMGRRLGGGGRSPGGDCRCPGVRKGDVGGHGSGSVVAVPGARGAAGPRLKRGGVRSWRKGTGGRQPGTRDEAVPEGAGSYRPLPEVAVGRWGPQGGAGRRAWGGACLRARPRQSQAQPGGVRAHRAREEGRAGRHARPIGAPPLHDVRLSREPSASRPGRRVSARARGRARRDFRRVPEAGAVCSHANGKERWGAGVARLRHFRARNGKELLLPAASPLRSPAARPARPRPCSRPSLTAGPRVARSPGTGAAAVGGRAAAALTGEHGGLAALRPPPSTRYPPPGFRLGPAPRPPVTGRHLPGGRGPQGGGQDRAGQSRAAQGAGPEYRARPMSG